MVEGMSVVVNVVLSLMSVMSPPPAVCSTHGGEVMYFGCVCFRGELGFLNCDDICSLSSLSLFLIPFMLTCSMMRILLILLLGLCPCVVSVIMLSSLVCL